jgi:Siphovirus ReqiPepy6 Gp37-like protein
VEVYALDSLYRRQTVVDRYISLIWTERLSSAGDFELDLPSTLENRNLFSKGTRLAMNESVYVMTVETVEDTTDDNDASVLKITGRSLEAVLDNRIARGSMNNLTDEPQWVLTGLPQAIATQIFHDICVTGILNPGDIIPMINEGSIFPADTIPPPPDSVTIALDPMTVYSALVQICNQFLMGFRLVRNGDTSQLYFDVYTGSDRTTHQSTMSPVLFSPDLGNLQNTSEISSDATYKNVAYVISAVGSEVVYALDVDVSVGGFDRRVLMVQADDITDPDPVIASAQMIQRGTEQLALNRHTSAFDGEISQTSEYKYGRDYYLGDLVSARNTDGVTNDMQVTEHIFSSDATGDHSYPTLALSEFVTPGSWLAEPPDEVWSDLLDTDHWADRP